MRCLVRRRQQGGFSLIELAVVLLILAVLLSIGIGALTTSYKAQQIRTTQSRINDIRSALSNYLRVRNHLPCPDNDFGAPDGYGEDDRATPNDPSQACTNRFGIVPYKDLGLDRDAAFDGWDNFFSYKVSNVNAAAPSTNRNWTIFSTTAASNEFFVGNDGAFSDSSTVAALGSGVTNAVVVIISHGPNGYGAYTEKGTRVTLPTTADASLVDEQVNTTTGLNFVARRPTDVPPGGGGGTFDDIVSYLLPADLLEPLIRDGTIKSAQGELQQRFDEEKARITGEVLRGVSYATGPCSDGSVAPTPCVAPARLENTYTLPASGALAAVDPWGTPLQYTQGVASIGSNTAAGNAFTITSYGPTRTANGVAPAGDDEALVVTVDELKGILGKTGF